MPFYRVMVEQKIFVYSVSKSSSAHTSDSRLFTFLAVFTDVAAQILLVRGISHISLLRKRGVLALAYQLQRL